MRILMFSITPLFPDHDMGGGQKHLRSIVLHLAEQGHHITLLSTRRDDSRTSFRWHTNAEVLPILRFRQPFPGPYDTGAHNLAGVIQDVAEHLERADVFYMHDGEFLFPFVYQRKPTVIGLRDNVYPETMQGMFHFSADRLIVISEYSRRFVLQTAGRFYAGLPNRLTVIRNSLDWQRFQPTPPRRIGELIPGVNPDQHAIVLHPHRPEESKGIWESIEVADRLVHRHGVANLRLLTPRWLFADRDPGAQDFYARVTARLEERGLTDHVVFHPWIPVDLLPEYFSLGQVTLSLGHFVETFGNAVYESLGCGTPSIVARVSTHRELLPEELIDKVDYGDHDSAAQIAADILRTKRRTSAETMATLHDQFSLETQMSAYTQAITGAKPAQPMPFRAVPIGEATRFALPVWCYRSPTRGVYHDFRADYRRDSALKPLLDAHPAGFTFAQAAQVGADREQVEEWYREGYLYPVVV